MKKKNYNFDERIDRKGTNSVKWDPETLEEMFSNPDALAFWVADMDFKSADPIIEAVRKVTEHGIYGYSRRPDSYFNSIIDWTQRRFGWEIEKDWIVYTPGVVPAINYVIQEFCSPGDKVLIQEPVYYPFARSIKNNQCQVVNNQLIEEKGEYRIDFEDLEEKLKDPALRLFILCSPHNPIARSWSEDELRRMADLCLKYDVLILADEIHNDLVYSWSKHHILASLDENYARNTITCTAPSKTFNLAGMQASNIIIPDKDIRKRFESRLEIANVGAQSPFSIAAVEAAYNESEEWLEELLDYLEANIEFMEDFFKERLPKAGFRRPDSTYLGWVDLRAYEKDAKKLEEKISQGGLALDGGSWFGPSGNGFVRINFACPRSLLEEALIILEGIIKE